MATDGNESSVSGAEQEVADVPILHHVVLAFDPQLARLPDFLLASMRLQVREVIDLGPDEALLEVGVDHAGRLGRGGTDGDGPRADLFLAGREVALKAQHAIRLAGEDGEG